MERNTKRGANNDERCGFRGARVTPPIILHLEYHRLHPTCVWTVHHHPLFSDRVGDGRPHPTRLLPKGNSRRRTDRSLRRLRRGRAGRGRSPIRSRGGGRCDRDTAAESRGYSSSGTTSGRYLPAPWLSKGVREWPGCRDARRWSRDARVRSACTGRGEREDGRSGAGPVGMGRPSRATSRSGPARLTCAIWSRRVCSVNG
jgi:hypothetical protein